MEFLSKIPKFDVDMNIFRLLKDIKPSWIIHIFALMHAAVALSCRLAGVDDELLLTVLTIAMAIIICLKKNLGIEFTAAIIIAGNILGFLMGTAGAYILESFISSPLTVHALSTAATTEVLGWSIVAIATIFRHDDPEEKTPVKTSPYIKWVLLAAAGIFIIRLGVVFLLSLSAFDQANTLAMTLKVLSNSVGMIILICLNILYIRYAVRFRKSLNIWKKRITLIVFMLVASLIETLIVNIELPLSLNPDFARDFPLIFSISLLTQLTIYCIIYMINYVFRARSEMQLEREKANIAQYRYFKLKGQVNPHFLFNCLNILDCLVCEEKTEQASTYIHKLAGIYRYMLNSEDEELVSLREELIFVGLYVDLLKVRFPEGFNVEISVPEEHLNRFVVPCSIQLMIENATKHNAVTIDNPLTVKVEVSGSSIRVSNNIVPKFSKSPSSGLGQKYIRQQYNDLSGKAIEISEHDDIYCVTLPLL